MARKKYESEAESILAHRALNELGVFSIKIKSAQENGYPDREFLIHGGKPLFIEMKRDGEEPKPYQLMIHERLRHFGYEVQVHDTVEEAMAAIRTALDRVGISTCALLRKRNPTPQSRRRGRP